ncbi:MAG TPA: hypothetical protein VLR92_08010 [Blastocatellia bacterium]|nr:hypothetical protein [Blastocatellia bacterium]
MPMKKLTTLIAVATLALVHHSDGQQAQSVAEQLKLAGVMPRGAMVYVQSSDLSAIMKSWLGSPVRSQFYESASFTAFEKSHVYLKLQDRIKDFQSAIGVGIDEKRLAELAGRASAVSLYDIGKLEMVFVTELPRARAVASTLFKQAPRFSERSANGTSYYVRDVTTDGGRLDQQFCFAYVEDKLIVTTTEGLMIRAIANAKAPGSDSLSPEVIALAEQAGGFSAHDVTMWLDQARLNRNRYFDSYWIHHNEEGELANVEAGLIDLRITREAMTEQRWFKMGAGGKPGTAAMPVDQVADLMRFAPADTQLVQVHAAVGAERLSAAVERALFGKLPEESWAPPEIPDRTRWAGGEDEHTRSERYSRLDSRFDVDVDDQQAPKRRSASGPQAYDKTTSKEAAASDFIKSVDSILASVSTTSYCELVRSRAETGKPFVKFDRAIIAQLKPDAAVNREALERLIVNELRSRFVVAGTEPQLEWQDEGAIRFVAQSLLEQGAAYSVVGNYLVLASGKEYASEILQAGRAGASPIEKADGAVAFFAMIRVAAAKPDFDTLMSKLDGRNPATASRGKDDEEEREVKFFSENLSTLVAATAIREVRLTRPPAGPIATEHVVYFW